MNEKEMNAEKKGENKYENTLPPPERCKNQIKTRADGYTEHFFCWNTALILHGHPPSLLLWIK